MLCRYTPISRSSSRTLLGLQLFIIGNQNISHAISIGNRGVFVELEIVLPVRSESQFSLGHTSYGNGMEFLLSLLLPPKNLIHPVLSLWNEKYQKCVDTLREEDHLEITIDHVSLRDCLEAGYILLKVHCFLEFEYVESLWRESTLKGVVEKTINSREAPVNKEAYIEEWDEAFPGVGAMFEERWARWVIIRL